MPLPELFIFDMAGTTVQAGNPVPAAFRPAPDLIYRAMQLTGCTDVGRVAVAGDTISDLEAAAAAGVRWNIGVLSGAHDRKMLETRPHTGIIASVADIPRLFTK